MKKRYEKYRNGYLTYFKKDDLLGKQELIDVINDLKKQIYIIELKLSGEFIEKASVESIDNEYIKLDIKLYFIKSFEHILLKYDIFSGVDYKNYIL